MLILIFIVCSSDHFELKRRGVHNFSITISCPLYLHSLAVLHCCYIEHLNCEMALKKGAHDPDTWPLHISLSTARHFAELLLTAADIFFHCCPLQVRCSGIANLHGNSESSYFEMKLFSCFCYGKKKTA